MSGVKKVKGKESKGVEKVSESGRALQAMFKVLHMLYGPQEGIVGF